MMTRGGWSRRTKNFLLKRATRRYRELS
jgi:hypothetical protein